MRSRAAPLAGLLLLVAALSGCFGTESGGPLVVPETNDSAAAASAANVTVDDGTTPMDADTGHAPHLHDYWTGRERVTLMDQEVTVDAQQAIPFTFFNAFMGTPGIGGTFVELPEGSIVFEGTGQLEFTVTWTDATVTGMALRYSSAASNDFSEPEPLASGTPLVIDVTPEMTDMPHEKTSRWGFLLTPGAAGQSMVGTFHVTVDIIRMRDIGLFPGHPELFGEANTLVLYSGPGESSQSNFATQTATFLTGGSFAEDGVASAKVVPMETLTMTANLTITDMSTSTGEVTEVWFMYRPADSWRYFRANLLEGDVASGVFRFAWPVEMEQTDSPYADTSQWRFDVRVGTQTTGIGPACDRCADVRVTYEVEIVAYDSRLADAGEDPAARGDN